MPLNTTKVHFGDWEGVAVRFHDEEAWALSWHDNKWQPLHPAEAVENARLLSEEQFQVRFPEAPPLPKEAFKNLDLA